MDISKSVNFGIDGLVSDEDIVINERKQKYKKTFTALLVLQSSLDSIKASHSKHSTKAFVTPLLSMNVNGQNRNIELFRKEAIRNHMSFVIR